MSEKLYPSESELGWQPTGEAKAAVDAALNADKERDLHSVEHILARARAENDASTALVRCLERALPMEILLVAGALCLLSSGATIGLLALGWRTRQSVIEPPAPAPTVNVVAPVLATDPPTVNVRVEPTTIHVPAPDVRVDVAPPPSPPPAQVQVIERITVTPAPPPQVIRVETVERADEYGTRLPAPKETP